MARLIVDAPLSDEPETIVVGSIAALGDAVTRLVTEGLSPAP